LFQGFYAAAMQMTSPPITVVITTRNRPESLFVSLASVLGQSLNDIELIVIDDASSPPASQVSGQFSDSRIRYFRNSARQGLSASRNLGLFLAKSEYIAFLDDDDWWHPDRLAVQLPQIRSLSSVYAVVCCAQQVTRIGGSSYINHPQIKGLISQSLKSGHFGTISSSAVFRVKILRKLGGFDPALTSQVDHDIWMQLARGGYKAEFLDIPLVFTRDLGQPRMTADVESRLDALEKYLVKWESYLNTLLGDRQALTYRRRYTAYVSCWLAEEEFKKGCLNSGMHVYGWAVGHNRGIMVLLASLFRSVAFLVLRQIYLFVPLPRRGRLFSVR